MSEAAAREILALPIFPELGAERQERVVQALARALGRPATGCRTAVVPQPKFLRQEERNPSRAGKVS